MFAPNVVNILLRKVSIPLVPLLFALIVITLVTLGGFFVVNPGEAKVLQLFGEYRGSVCAQGVWFDMAHAVGNVVIALAIGPELRRLLERYARRMRTVVVWA